MKKWITVVFASIFALALSMPAFSQSTTASKTQAAPAAKKTEKDAKAAEAKKKKAAKAEADKKAKEAKAAAAKKPAAKK